MTKPSCVRIGDVELEEAVLRAAGWLPAEDLNRAVAVARAVATIPDLPALVRGPVEERVIAALGRGLDLEAAVAEARSAWTKAAPPPPPAATSPRQGGRNVVLTKEQSQDLGAFQAAEKRAAEQGGTIVFAD